MQSINVETWLGALSVRAGQTPLLEQPSVWFGFTLLRMGRWNFPLVGWSEGWQGGGGKVKSPRQKGWVGSQVGYAKKGLRETVVDNVDHAESSLVAKDALNGLIIPRWFWRWGGTGTGPWALWCRPVSPCGCSQPQHPAYHLCQSSLSALVRNIQKKGVEVIYGFPF